VVKAGEGVQSLACAFLHAQARAVVASLWPVEDRDAGAILRDFQRRRLENPQLQPARALRSARLEFRKGEMRSSGVNGENVQRRWEPWKWASWVYIGAPPPSD
jgi:CHAT domain-containing protein